MIEQYIASDKVSMMYDLLEVVSETHYTIGKGKDDTGNEIQHRNVNPFLFRQFTGLFLDYADDLAPLLYINQEKVRFLQVLIGNVIISSRDIDELLQKLETLDSDYFTGELLKHFFTILKPKRSEEEMSRVTDLSNGVLYGILQESDLPGSVKYGIYSAVANPRRTIRKLYEFVWQLYGRLAAIYRRNQDQLQAARKSLIKTIHSEGIYFIDQREKLPIDSYSLKRKSILYMLCLARPTWISFKDYLHSHAAIILGVEYSKQLTQELTKLYHAIIKRGLLTQDCIKIVQILLKRQVTETDLSEILGISRFTVSEYLNILVQTQPITVEKIGNQLYFSIRNRYACEAKNLLHNLQRALEREVKRYVFMDLPKD